MLTTGGSELGVREGTGDGDAGIIVEALKEFAARLTVAGDVSVSVAAWGLVEALERLT